MENLRIVTIQVVDSTSITATFTHKLTSNLVPSNISIISDTMGVPDSKALRISVSGELLHIECQPLTNLASYFIQFSSTTQHPFISLNGDAKLLEDGVANKMLILGPLDPENPVKDFFDNYFRDNIYKTDDDTSMVSKYIKSLSIDMARALHDIGQLKNDNYLSVNITDERKVRGEGPFDRLNEEGAYEILRVGRTATGTSATTSLVFSDFPSYPITLQRQSAFETAHADSVNEVGKFNIDNLILTLSNKPVTKINSIVFTLNTINPIYTYDIPSLGYQIQDSKYDQDFSFTFVSLESDQIKLSEKLLTDPNFSISNIIKIDIQYEYKNLGIVVDSSTTEIYTNLVSQREVIPPIVNTFTLNHAPIVDSNGNIPTANGIIFANPNSNLPNAKHPAFITEVPFGLNILPSKPGQYSVDYASGTVYVFGASLSNDGTGPTPPLLTYNYKFTYQNELDYAYDMDANDVVALPNGNLLANKGIISFSYEQVLIPDVDYKTDIHQESLNERIQNRLIALNALRVKNSPITNVFRIINETSGEIYTLDRWNNDKVYFRFNNAPTINDKLAERVTFDNVTNELLFVDSTLINAYSLRIFKILLKNNTLTSASEDSLGASFNSSVSFSKSNIFINEKWFNKEYSETANINRLLNVGEYIVDYANGVIYCAVSNTQNNDIGTINYRTNKIVPEFPHLISVNDIFCQLSPLSVKNKTFPYLSFDDGEIIPDGLNLSDELYLNGNSSAFYQIFNKQIGIFFNSSFVSGVTDQVKSVRGVFEFVDLLNSTHPLNFAEASSFNDFNISTSSISKQVFENVSFDGSNYYVTLNENIPYLSPNITYTFSVIRTKDLAQLWNMSGTIVPGNPVKLVLSGVNSPQIGDFVNITYSFTINDLSRVVVDYNKGDLYIDYTYLADEILVSYEYGDNSLDFRTNTTLSSGDEYFVSYRAGALRDALYKNFGNLVNIPELTNFNLDFDRERYRDALTAATTSFVQGPTIAAIKNIGKTISHIEPEVIESALQNWSLGSSLLEPKSVETTGAFTLLPVKYSNGALFDSNQTVTVPVNSNIRFEEGTFETWISPSWNGLDNDAKLTFNILRDGYAINSTQIFIGASEYHPVIENGTFTLSKLSSVIGKPNTNKDGVFIYYDKDISGNFYRWYVQLVDGYIYPTHSNYTFKISSDGQFYDTKSTILPKPSNLSIFSSANTISFSITDGYMVNEGITFLSDPDHYILDFGVEKNKSRLSIYKDVSGYMNLRVYDKDKNVYSISSDISSWKAGDLHHVAASWKLNTKNNRDELHLFIDGFEVPNIIKYGQKLKPYLHEKYRTVNPEEILGLSSRDIVGSVDLQTTAGSTSVTSSINFSSYNIFIGDTIFIDEDGFSPLGYTITGISGQTLALGSVMPKTITNGRFSVNRTQFTASLDIDVSPNIAVSTIHAMIVGTDLSTTSGSSNVSSTSLNFTTLGVLPGYLIRINNPSLEITYHILSVTGNTLKIDSNLPVTLSNATFQIYSNTENEIPGVRALRPSYSITKDNNFNNILTISNNVFAHDLILIRTLGLNHRRIKRQYYVWSDNQENVLMTRLPPPISLDSTKITKIILSPTVIGPGNSTLSGGLFTSNNLITYQPSNAQNGRTLSVTLNGTNTDFSTPVQVTINGESGIYTINETITFTNYGTLDFVNPFISINYINVVVKPINSSKPALTVEVKEKYPITHLELSDYGPVIRYSYNIGSGYNLTNDGYGVVRDGYNLFSALDINNYLLIGSPSSVAGYYIITGVSSDRHSLSIIPAGPSASLPLAAFNNGIYKILNVNDYRSGLQEGFFTFEANLLPSQQYFLNKGPYELEYFTYTQIKLDPSNIKAYIGSDFNGQHQLDGAMDQVKIYSIMLTDTRIGETVPSNQRTITKDFNSLKALKKDTNTLVLLSFDSFPFVNEAGFYINPTTVKRHFQSSTSINENFGNSIVFTNDPLIVSNDGILDTKKEGTIEFWANPIYDTGNDPNERYYFDATSAIVEEAVSVNNVSVKISKPASQILSVTLKNGDPKIDYFAGGKLEIDTQKAVQEQSISIGNNTVTTSLPILQVITIKIVGDATETNYFENGAIGTDQKTIYLDKLLPSNNLPVIVTYQSTENKNVKLNTQVIRLNRKLPTQNSKVIVTYVPKGLQGDRLSIFKDNFGYVNFSVTASGKDYLVRAPTRWVKGTWHRVKASYKFNGGLGNDEMRLFIDGYEFTNITFGSGVTIGKFPEVMGGVEAGDGYVLTGNIRFKDPINELFIGSKFDKTAPIFSLLDNLRISNISRPIYAPYGEPVDVNYNKNLNVVFPVTEDLYTTYLLDFNSLVFLNEDFAILKNRKTGAFDFSVNILDSFDIVLNSIKSKEALEKLIKILKPANSKVLISYIR